MVLFGTYESLLMSLKVILGLSGLSGSLGVYQSVLLCYAYWELCESYQFINKFIHWLIYCWYIYVLVYNRRGHYQKWCSCFKLWNHLYLHSHFIIFIANQHYLLWKCDILIITLSFLWLFLHSCTCMLFDKVYVHKSTVIMRRSFRIVFSIMLQH